MKIKCLLVLGIFSTSLLQAQSKINDNWADWEVEFTVNGKSYVGFLGACPFHPEDMHDDDIIEAEELA